MSEPIIVAGRECHLLHGVRGYSLWTIDNGEVWGNDGKWHKLRALHEVQFWPTEAAARKFARSFSVTSETVVRETIVVDGRECRFIHNRSGDAERHYDHGWYITDGEGRFMRRFADGSYEWSWGYCGDEGHWPTEAAAREFALASSQPGKGDETYYQLQIREGCEWLNLSERVLDGSSNFSTAAEWFEEAKVYHAEQDMRLVKVTVETLHERAALPAAPAGG